MAKESTPSPTLVGDIPIVDFSKFLHGDEEQKRTVAKQIDRAFRETGFVYLIGHGIGPDRVSEAFKWSNKFFALPTSIKMLAPHPPGGSHHRGYSGLGQEKISQELYSKSAISKAREVADVKESFESGNINDPMQPNLWVPESHIPGFRGFMESFFWDCSSLIHTLLSTLSIALDVPTPGLSPTHAQSLFQLRLLHYPSLPSRLLRTNAKTRINAHSDFGTLTLLFQDSVGGLEIQDPDPAKKGVWRTVPPVKDAVLVNVGDLMARWSNGRWRSTMHRVGAPPRQRGGAGGRDEEEEEMCEPRYSIPFFATADMDTVIDALPGCWDDEHPKLYEPVTAWEYVQMRMAALYE